MAYYYTNSNDHDQDQDYPLNNYTYYNNQSYYNNDHHHNNFYNSNSYDQEYEYGYSNDQYYYYDTQFQTNPYQHLPTQSLIVYHHNSSTYENPEIPAKKLSNFFPDPDVSTGFVISYSNTQPTTTTHDLDIEIFHLEPFHGGYDMNETYGKPLPASEDICYPPSKIDLTPPPSSPFGKLGQIPETPSMKKEEEQASEPDEDEDDDETEEEEDDDEPEEEEIEKGGIFIAPPVLGKQNHGALDAEQSPESDEDEDETEEEEEEGDDDDETVEEEIEKGGIFIAPSLLGKQDHGALDEEQSSGTEEDEEEEEKIESLDGGRTEEKVIKPQIQPGYGLEPYDLCGGVFGGYFPCMRKRNLNQESGDQIRSMSYSSNEDANGDCLKFTMDYLFGDPDPYARARPDPVYGYQRYYPQEPLWEQVEYGGNYSISLLDNPNYYGYDNPS